MGDNRVSKEVGGFEPKTVRIHDSGSYVVSPDVEFDTVTAKADSGTFEFYHAKSYEQRYQGLSGRKSLATDGMVFEYPSVKKRRLVFRNMHFPLDVLFLDEDGMIIDRDELSDDNPSTESVCLYAIEVEKGWPEEHDVSIGDSFDFPFNKLAKQVPDKYLDGTGLSEDDFVPNTDVNNVVEDVLEFIDEHGLPNPDAQREGASRANQIHDHFVDNEPLGYEYWEEIYNFHQRHRAQGNNECDESSIAESDKEEINQNEHDVCFFDNGYFSDHTWGSDAGYEQAERIVTAVEDAGVEKQWSPYEGPQGGFGWTDGEEVIYQEEPPGPVDVSNLTDEQTSALEDELGQSFTDNDSLDTEVRVEESVDIEQVENPVFVDSQQIKDSLSDTVERTKQDVVADNFLDNLDRVTRESRGGAYYSGSEEFVNLPADSTDGSMHHELGHALLGSNGSKSRNGATLIARLHMYDRNFVDSLDPSDLIGESPSTLSSILADNIDIDIQRFPDFQSHLGGDVSRDMFRIDVPEDTSEEMQNLVRELNDAWERQFDNYGEVYIQDAYSASNAHETMARLHEHLQNPGINYNVMDDLIEDFPDLLEAYIEVIEPNDNQIRYLEEEGFI